MTVRNSLESGPVLKNAISTGDGMQPIEMKELCKALLETSGNWPKRVNRRLFVRDSAGKICWLDSTSSLFAWIQSDVMKVKWFKNVGCVSKEEFWADLCRTVEAFEGIESFPHEPLVPRHYYACSIPAKTSSGRLDELVSMFGVESPLDTLLIKSMALTLFWGGRPGARPAFVITSDQGPGSGKTTLADVMASLVDGAIDASPKDDVAGLKTRLFSDQAGSKRVVLIDNVKSSKFSWADLEALITRPTISGRALYIGEARINNYYNWIVTLNGVSLSADIAQRAIVIKLRRGAFDGTFRERVFNFVEDHRQEIIGDAIAELYAAKPDTDRLEKYSRWATWEVDVLDRLPSPRLIQQLILERQNDADDDADEAITVDEYIEAQLRANGQDPETAHLQIDTQTASRWVIEALGDRRLGTTAACRRLQDMIRRGKISGLKPMRSKHRRYYIYKGPKGLGEIPIVYTEISRG